MEPKRLEKTDTVTNKTEYAIGDFVIVAVIVVKGEVNGFYDTRDSGEPTRTFQKKALYNPCIGQIVGLKNVQVGRTYRIGDEEGMGFVQHYQITLWEVKTGYANKPLLCLPSGIIRSESTERLPVLQTR